VWLSAQRPQRLVEEAGAAPRARKEWDFQSVDKATKKLRNNAKKGKTPLWITHAGVKLSTGQGPSRS
jgi:hypothetical protein